jgi:maleate cis-trans isomerase
MQPDMPALPQRSIGVITPSANVVVEWTSINLMRAFPQVGLNFSRTPVSGTVDPHPHGYDLNAMVDAAKLLAHARPQAIVWAGSKGVLIGVKRIATCTRASQTQRALRRPRPLLRCRTSCNATASIASPW